LTSADTHQRIGRFFERKRRDFGQVVKISLGTA
jgi:hypothetical protein